MITVVVGTPEFNIAGWSSLVARRAHNPKVVGSNPAPATIYQKRVFNIRSHIQYLIPEILISKIHL